MNKITVKPYSENRDSEALFSLMKKEEDWTDYSGSFKAMEKYKTALRESVTYVLYYGGICCGFIRARDDFGFGVYIHDLLVGKDYRGNSYGKILIEQVCKIFKGTIYVMSDVDQYYFKQGYDKVEGRIIIVK